jgi:hypothetical protein
MRSPKASYGKLLVIASSLSLIIGGDQLHAVEADNFRATTTGDLVVLCSAHPAAPNYTAAIHFCHGFTSGAYAYYALLAAAVPDARFVCVPDPAPSRSEAIDGFIDWARRNPDFTTSHPVDSIFRYLAEQYPCAPATASR